MFNGTTTFNSSAMGLVIRALDTDDGVIIEVTPGDCAEPFTFECERQGDAIALIAGLQREGMPRGRDRAAFMLRHRWVPGIDYVLDVQERIQIHVAADGEFDSSMVL